YKASSGSKAAKEVVKVDIFFLIFSSELADVLAEAAQWERHGRTLVHLLLTPHCSHDAEYFSEQVAVPGDDGAWELGLLQWLWERLGQAQFQWLLARGNAASSSTALHTAARHAGERTQGLQLLEFITLHVSPDLLLARTQQSYLPYHSACRSRCRPAVSLLLQCWAQACSRSAVSPESVLFQLDNKYFRRSGACALLDEVALQYGWRTAPPDAQDGRLHCNRASLQAHRLRRLRSEGT
ncbi:hypothetical protein HaLaN_16281, partial [Haematococcus lacustris]